LYQAIQLAYYSNKTQNLNYVHYYPIKERYFYQLSIASPQFR